MYKCRICSKEFSEIPPDAVEIAAKRRGVLYQFGDNTVHDLYRVRPKSADHRWHKSKTWDCIFCFPKQKPEPPVAEPVLAQEVQLEKLPEPEIVEEAEQAESQLSSIASLSAAFSRIRSKKDSR